jgi:hypothetical protein
MNRYKQSKSSVIFTACWTGDKGATTEEVYDALWDAGFDDMPLKSKLLPMLKTYQRKGWILRQRDRWVVLLPGQVVVRGNRRRGPYTTKER